MQENEEDIYIKYINGTLSEDERQALEASGELEVLDQILTASDNWKLPAPKQSYFEFKQSKLSGKKKENEKPKSNRRWMAIAASVAVIIGVSVFSYLRFFDITTYTTGAGETLAVELPDGTAVELNGSSSLSFNNWGWEADRKVEIEGQAYFEVEKKGKFQVGFDGGAVEVLGTKFDVMAYRGVGIVKCYEGKVAVDLGDKHYDLTKGQGARSSEDSNQEFTFTEEAPTWRNKYSQFEAAPLYEVLNALALKFDLDFELLDRSYINLDFTGQFPNDDRDMALKLVFESLSIKYNIDGNKVVLQ